jgi:enterobactin synthetase component D
MEHPSMADVARLSLARHPGALPDAFVLSFDPSESDAARFAAHGIACPPTIARSVSKRRAEYLAGRRVALAALAAAGVHVGDLGSSASRAPCWPEGFIGSITHAARTAAAVAMPVGPLRGVGLDLEDVVSDSAIEAILATVVTEAEVSALVDLVGQTDRATALTAAFSAKESFFKATAATVGRIFDFSALTLVHASTGEGIIDAAVAEDLAPSLPRGTPVRLGFSLLDNRSVVTTCAWQPERPAG